MKIAVGTTGSKHLAASHSTDIFVGPWVRACGSGEPHELTANLCRSETNLNQASKDIVS